MALNRLYLEKYNELVAETSAMENGIWWTLCKNLVKIPLSPPSLISEISGFTFFKNWIFGSQIPDGQTEWLFFFGKKWAKFSLSLFFFFFYTGAHWFREFQNGSNFRSVRPEPFWKSKVRDLGDQKIFCDQNFAECSTDIPFWFAKFWTLTLTFWDRADLVPFSGPIFWIQDVE